LRSACFPSRYLFTFLQLDSNTYNGNLLQGTKAQGRLVRPRPSCGHHISAHWRHSASLPGIRYNGSLNLRPIKGPAQAYLQLVAKYSMHLPPPFVPMYVQPIHRGPTLFHPIRVHLRGLFNREICAFQCSKKAYVHLLIYKQSSLFLTSCDRSAFHVTWHGTPDRKCAIAISTQTT